jgi:hypothetical protein
MRDCESADASIFFACPACEDRNSAERRRLVLAPQSTVFESGSIFRFAQHRSGTNFLRRTDGIPSTEGVSQVRCDAKTLRIWSHQFSEKLKPREIQMIVVSVRRTDLTQANAAGRNVGVHNVRSRAVRTVQIIRVFLAIDLNPTRRIACRRNCNHP